MRYIKTELTDQRRKEITEALAKQRFKLSNVPVCDFCGSDNPIWVYRARRMSTGVHRDCWRWCACADCSFQIDHHNYRELRMRIEDRLRPVIASRLDVPSFTQNMLNIGVREALSEFFRDAATESTPDGDMKIASNNYNAHAETCPLCKEDLTRCDEGLDLLQRFHNALNSYLGGKEDA